MKIETRFDLGGKFLYYRISVVSPINDFVPCPKCDGKGFFKGSGGQKHKCRSCETFGRNNSLLVPGFIPGEPTGFVPGANRTVIEIRVGTIHEIRISGSVDEPCINLVYDYDYDGDPSVTEDEAFTDLETVLAKASAEYLERKECFDKAGWGKFGGVIFMDSMEGFL